MNVNTLQLILQDALLTFEAARDELRDLDAAIGDGDLGITVSEGARAVREALSELPSEATIAELLKVAARAFASANPSTMAALVSGGLAAAARSLPDRTELDRPACTTLLAELSASIGARGGAQLGDKTILDALEPTLALLRESDADDRATLREMISAAQAAVVDTAALQSRRGRAAWVGERTIGHPDGGATAYLRFLQAIERALPARLSPARHDDRGREG